MGYFIGEIQIGPWAVTGTVLLAVAQWGLIPHLLSQRHKAPNATLAWLWAILLFPIVGGVFYLLMGSERVQRRRLKSVNTLKFRTAGLRTGPRGQASQPVPELELINGFPLSAGNEVGLLPDGERFFPALLEIIAAARDHLHLEFYTWEMDRAGRTVRDALTRAAARGVEVRLLVDEIGSWSTLRRFFRPVLKQGGKFSWFHTFSPLRGRLHLNLRNHRKLVIADGSTALTGGINIGDEYWTGKGKSPPYRDLQMRLRGPVVTQLAEVFMEDWYFASGEALTDAGRYCPPQEVAGTVETQVVPGGPDNELNEIQLTILVLLQRTRRRLRIMTPYFVPENAVVSALQLAAMRGVAVDLMVPARGDHGYLTHVTRSCYDSLLPYGIRIFEYQPSLLHAKVVIIDEDKAFCGSANMDVRSLRINFELNVALQSAETNAGLNALFEENLSRCEEITAQSHAARPFHLKLLEAVCRPLSSLL